MTGRSKNKATPAGGFIFGGPEGISPARGDKLRLPQAHGKMKTALSDGFHFGGPEGIRTLDLSDANELKTLICIDFQTFPALSAGMQMALWPLFPVVTMCPGSVCGTRCGHRKTGGKASILGAPIIARNRKSVNGFLNPWRRKPLDAIIKE